MAWRRCGARRGTCSPAASGGAPRSPGLITDHNVHETLAITDRAYILIDGAIYKHGTAEELADDEEVRRHYLGESFTLERYKIADG